MEDNLFEILNEILNPYESDILNHIVEKLMNDTYNEEKSSEYFEGLIEHKLHTDEKIYFKELLMKILINYIMQTNQLKLAIDELEEQSIIVKEKNNFLKDENEQLYELRDSLNDQVIKLKNFLNEADSISKNIYDELNSLNKENKRLIGVLNHFKEFDNENQNKIGILTQQNSEIRSALECLQYKFLESEDQVKVLRSLLSYYSVSQKGEVQTNSNELQFIKKTNSLQVNQLKRLKSSDTITMRKKLRKSIRSEQFKLKKIRVKSIESEFSDALHLRFDSIENIEYTIPRLNSAGTLKTIFLCEKATNDQADVMKSSIHKDIWINSSSYLRWRQPSIDFYKFSEFETPVLCFTPKKDLYQSELSEEKFECTMVEKTDYENNTKMDKIFEFQNFSLNENTQREKIKMVLFTQNRLSKMEKPICYVNLILPPIFYTISITFKIIKKVRNFRMIKIL